MGLLSTLLRRLVVALAVVALSLPLITVCAFVVKPDLCKPLVETVADLDLKDIARSFDGYLWPEGMGPKIIRERMTGDAFVGAICASILTAFLSSISVTVSLLLLIVSPLHLLYKVVSGGGRATYS